MNNMRTVLILDGYNRNDFELEINRAFAEIAEIGGTILKTEYLGTDRGYLATAIIEYDHPEKAN